MKVLDNIGVLIGEKFALHYIRVEGHTDNLPINSFLYPSNWELSSARSSSVIRYLIQRFKFMPNIFTAIGYSDTRPLVENTTDENRAKNRRVEILVLKNKFRGLEHATTSILTQSKKAQEAFQKQRTETIQRIKNASPELKKIKLNKNISKEDIKQVDDKPVKPENEKESTVSVRNKNLYEKVEEQDVNNKNLDDNWLGTGNNKILQRDINKQFDMIGQ